MSNVVYILACFQLFVIWGNSKEKYFLVEAYEEGSSDLERQPAKKSSLRKATVPDFKKPAHSDLRGCFERNIFYRGKTINRATKDKTNSAAECQDLCFIRERCLYFTWIPDHTSCLMRTNIKNRKKIKGVISGHRTCGFGKCSSEESECKCGGQCISNVKRCDGNMDCIDASDESSNSCGKKPVCPPVCPAEHPCGIGNDGRPFIVQGTSRTTSSHICSSGNLKHAESWKMGEAPSVLSSNPYNQEIGRYWLKHAEAEHASVASFARHTLQLMSIGAPSRLLVASQEASVDEIKHAKLCYGFASAFIGIDLGPGSLDVHGSLQSMDLNSIIRSLIIEGCIEETLSAIEAHFAAHNAQDSAVKAAVSEIAFDETKHAQLAWDTIKWIIEKYPNSRILAEEIFHVELEQRMMSVRNDSSLFPTRLCEDAKDTTFRRYGLLVSGDREKVREAGFRNIIEPIYRAGFKGVNMISKQIKKLDVATLVREAETQDLIEPVHRSTMLT